MNENSTPHQAAKEADRQKQGSTPAQPVHTPVDDDQQTLSTHRSQSNESLSTGQPASSDGSATAQSWMPQIADDTDLIEKEWVDKAKEVVSRTGHDPYLQNQELNKVKVEYLKKRYSRDLKQSD